MSLAWMRPSPVDASVAGRLARLGISVLLLAISLGCTDQSRLVEPPGDRLEDRPIVVAPNAVTTIAFQLVCTRRGISG
jgi:hypothetical protein